MCLMWQMRQEQRKIVVRALEAHRSAVAALNEEEAASPALATAQPLVVDVLVVTRSIGGLGGSPAVDEAIQ